MRYAVKTAELFDFSHTVAGDLLQKCTYPWEALAHIGAWINAIGPTLPTAEYECVAEQIWVARSACVAATACLSGPCIIGHETEVRHGALVRGAVLVGDGAVVGNSSELKNAILLDGAKVPHFNYVGDSILGHRAHLGAGAVISNVKGDGSPVTVRTPVGSRSTGHKKLGAMVGDGAEIGCGCVLNPGTVVGKGSRIYPLVAVRGVVPQGVICKQAGDFTVIG